ncbi:hypothetical protein ABNF97_16225 [Plantactinospora sp. B6F1]|uniref:hypothetical protein n=1 Tax=Plantactinospora sp. B6F1 TaxID=3158971 RepID=UPI00102CFB9C
MTTTTEPVAAEVWRDALAFQAPFLIEKLTRDHVVESAEEAEALFREVKRYLVLAAADHTVAWAMYSLRIDQVWHQFILFTRQYIDYCLENFGRYIQHAPSTAPPVENLAPPTRSTFDQFADAYERLFGEPLPDLWFDERGVTLDRRLVNTRAGTLSLRDSDDDMVELLGEDGRPLFAVEQVGRNALDFISRTGTFFVRELPGELLDVQKIALTSTLVEHKLLDLAS